MPKATRNRSLTLVRDQLAAATRERDKLNANIDVLTSLEEQLVEAYNRKPARAAKVPRARRVTPVGDLTGPGNGAE